MEIIVICLDFIFNGFSSQCSSLFAFSCFTFSELNVSDLSKNDSFMTVLACHFLSKYFMTGELQK